jgi:CRP/FNR family transcriptional regulator, cyclic AMP receptor protein
MLFANDNAAGSFSNFYKRTSNQRDRPVNRMLANTMKVVQDLSIQDRCQDCGLRSSGAFCQLPEMELRRFESIKATKAYPKGTLLYAEGQAPAGVFMLCQGRVKLSTCSPDGKVIIIGIAEPGDVLGLSAVVNNVDYETSAEVLELCQVNYIKKADLLDFLHNNPEACLNAARQLGRNYQAAYRQICALGMSDSVTEKLAKLFLSWSGNGTGGNGRVQLKNFFTHEEIAEMICTSRETVTRALRYFREEELVTLKGPDLIIHDRQRLKAMVSSHGGIRTDM